MRERERERVYGSEGERNFDTETVTDGETVTEEWGTIRRRDTGVRKMGHATMRIRCGHRP